MEQILPSHALSFPANGANVLFSSTFAPEPDKIGLRRTPPLGQGRLTLGNAFDAAFRSIEKLASWRGVCCLKPLLFRFESLL